MTVLLAKRNTILLLCLAVCLHGCGSGPVAVDPCANAERVKARFTIYERVALPEHSMIVPSHTIVEGLAIFSANERYDSYEWQIGYDTRVWTDSSFSLRFGSNSGVPKGEPLPVRFIGRRQPNSSCFPDDDGIDTAFRKLVLMHAYTSPILGSYRGVHLDEPLDTFTVEIFWHKKYFLSMSNINRGCFDTIDNRFEASAIDKDLGATVMVFGDGWSYWPQGCRAPMGVARLFDHRKIEIQYTYEKARIPKTFVGWRVP